MLAGIFQEKWDLNTQKENPNQKDDCL